MKHDPETCEPDCSGCHLCDGGLIACKVCKGAEASLPTHCPGYVMSREQEEGIQAGWLDFRDGLWVDQTAPGEQEVVESAAPDALPKTLTLFLYLLLRDRLSFGAVEDLMMQAERACLGGEVVFSEETQHAYALDLAQRLTSA